MIDVNVGDPGFVISLITPGGSQINAANASSLGFNFTSYTSDGSTSDAPSLFEASGTHTVIQFPAGQASGTYQVIANTTAAADDTAMVVTYLPTSNVRA